MKPLLLLLLASVSFADQPTGRTAPVIARQMMRIDTTYNVDSTKPTAYAKGNDLVVYWEYITPDYNSIKRIDTVYYWDFVPDTLTLMERKEENAKEFMRWRYRTIPATGKGK